ncbi:MAG TPA: hypothetical protein VFG48_03315, partial [Xanthomonadales bacterium]|nr:hypothetical protein [Xanthomonadales bacterium]
MTGTQSMAASEGARSPGLWRLAWRRLRQDKVAVVCMLIVAAYLLAMLGSATGLIAADWENEDGVSYANPAFLEGAANLE